MWNFQYKHGDRPLDGYTIQRGAGRGGFGEVYYAISDSGREVALKAIQGYEQIELRGISQCMNLKNPHLVTVFDVKYNDQGRPFVIMEFVNGPSLRQLLDESPAGLGEQKSAFFLREIGKGLTYLHDNGIVHRDLKPANIFFENGYVKIGDYGLSKAIESTAHTTQTVTVGTVHYMAPEVGAGKYDRSIDIYALGAVLYEMLTGMVPFSGASPSEVLLKHLSSSPDCSGISEPFATVIKKAMAKDPAQRYQSVQEMVEAVFGAEHVRQSMSVFSPDELSVVAGHVAQRVAVGAGAAAGATVGGGSKADPMQAQPADLVGRAGAWANRMTDRIADAGGRIIGGNPAAPSSHTYAVAPELRDPMNAAQRRMLALLLAFGCGVGSSATSGFYSRHTAPWAFSIGAVICTTLAIAAAAAGIRMGARMLPQIEKESAFLQRLAMGGLATLFSFPFWIFEMRLGKSSIVSAWVAIFVPLFFMNTAKWVRTDRRERLNFWETAFLAGLFSFIIAPMLKGDPLFAAIVSCGICLVAQVLSPWDPTAARRGTARERINQRFNEMRNAVMGPPTQPATSPAAGQFGASASFSSARAFRPVNAAVRIGFLVFATITLALGISLLVAAGMASSNDFAGFLCSGLVSLWTSLIIWIQAARSRAYSIFSYHIRPVLIFLCGIAVIIPATFLGTQNLQAGEIAVLIFFIVLFSIGLLVSVFIPGPRRPQPASAETLPPPIPDAPAPQQQQQQQQQQSQSSEKPMWEYSSHEWNNWFERRRFRQQRHWMRWQQRREQSRQRRAEWRQRRYLSGESVLAFPAFLALAIATLLAAAVAVNLPEAIVSGLPDTSLARDLNRAFSDYPQWPDLLLRLGTFAAVVFGIIAAALYAIARRTGGILHIFRALLGVAALIWSACILRFAFRDFAWADIAREINAHHPTAAVAAALDAIRGGQLLLSGFTLLFAIILFCWPRRTPPAAPSPTSAPGAAQTDTMKGAAA